MGRPGMARCTRGIRAALAVLPLLVAAREAGAPPLQGPYAGCYYPSSAVFIFEENFFAAIELSDDSGRLKGQCKDFLKGCKKTIKHVTNCIESGNAATENAAIEACREIADPEDRASCKDAAKATGESLDAELDSHKSNAEQECESCYEACLAGDTCERPA